jgi:hypothetical protein
MHFWKKIKLLYRNINCKINHFNINTKKRIVKCTYNTRKLTYRIHSQLFSYTIMCMCVSLNSNLSRILQ